jgi:N-acetylneuraminic acid mutarotase
MSLHFESNRPTFVISGDRFAGKRWLLLLALVLLFAAQAIVAAIPVRAARSWERGPELAESLYALAAAAAPDGSVYAVGGAGENDATTDVYRLRRKDAGHWSAAPSLPAPRYRLAAATGGDGRIYAIGGYEPGYQGWRSSVFALKPGSKAWVTVASMPTPRDSLGAATGADGRIYVVGGYNLLLGGPLATLEIYDPETNEWTQGPPMPTPRYGLGVALGDDGRIYAIGGVGGGVYRALDVVEAYSPTADTWTTVHPLPSPRATFSAAAGPDGSIYVVSGQDFAKDSPEDTARVDRYSPEKNTWETSPETTVAHTEGVAVSSYGRILLIGGHTSVVESLRFR